MNTDPLIPTSAPSQRRVGARAPKRRPLHLRCFGASDQGLARNANEDGFLVAPLTAQHRSGLPAGAADRGHVLAVADGMGGANAGELASALALRTVKDLLVPALSAEHEPDRSRILDGMRAVLERADARLLAEAARSPDLMGMGTTLTLAYTFGRELYVAHVGDSRCYVLHHDTLCQVTTDHTFVQQMVRQGVLAPERAAHHGLRHVLTNVIGGNANLPEVEVRMAELSPGDVLLLCTDGLTEVVGDDEITAILQEMEEPTQACETLIARANERGGPDNVTTIVARCALAE